MKLCKATIAMSPEFADAEHTDLLPSYMAIYKYNFCWIYN